MKTKLRAAWCILLFLAAISLAEAAQFARPDADVSNAGAWADNGATCPGDTDGVGLDELDEAAADDCTTAITSGTNPDATKHVEVNLSDVVDPDSDATHII